MHANIISKLDLKLGGANHYLMKRKAESGILEYPIQCSLALISPTRALAAHTSTRVLPPS
jgi:hypothetical protein